MSIYICRYKYNGCSGKNEGAGKKMKKRGHFFGYKIEEFLVSRTGTAGRKMQRQSLNEIFN